MKQKDYILIIATALFSAVISFVLSSMFISPDSERTQTAEVVEVISADFRQPPRQYFNGESENPTQLIRISPDAPDTSPFRNQ